MAEINLEYSRLDFRSIKLDDVNEYETWICGV